MIKLKNRKVVDVNAKFCINCQMDFNEKENYNWSCNYHSATFGEHMWWCCGKREFNAKGCKIGMHLTQDPHGDVDLTTKAPG